MEAVRKVEVGTLDSYITLVKLQSHFYTLSSIPRTLGAPQPTLVEGLGLVGEEALLRLRPPPPYLPAPNASSSECAAYSSVLVVVDVVEVNVIMGAGMHSLVSCFAVNSSNLAVVEVIIRML